MLSESPGGTWYLGRAGTNCLIGMVPNEFTAPLSPLAVSFIVFFLTFSVHKDVTLVLERCHT